MPRFWRFDGLRPSGSQISVWLSITSAPAARTPITSRFTPLTSISLADHRPSAERRPPQLVRKDDDARRQRRRLTGRRRRPGDVGLALGEQAALDHLNAQRPEQIVGDRGRADPRRPIARREVHLAGREGPDLGERLVDLAELEEFGRRHPELLEAHVREPARQIDELIGLRVPERPQDDGVHHGEDRRIGANPERQRQDGDGGEGRRDEQGSGRPCEGPGGGNRGPSRHSTVARPKSRSLGAKAKEAFPGQLGSLACNSFRALEVFADAVEVPGLPNRHHPTIPPRRMPSAERGLSLSRVPPGAGRRIRTLDPNKLTLAPLENRDRPDPDKKFPLVAHPTTVSGGPTVETAFIPSDEPQWRLTRRDT